MRDGLTSDGILLAVRGEDDLCAILKVLNQVIDVDDVVPNE